ncbi:MAG TPA: hypothetical protein VHY09_04350 [Candidatus Methylacidiphilales bacterium]|jgi:hypothetical protein|nr:hypothetical protein [Candidatus Methylacidiphilales bacterium]
MHDTLWASWWVLTVLLCGWKLAEGFWNPRRMLEWPFLACAMWIYFYGYMAYKAQTTLSAYLGNGMSDIGQLMALLCLVGLLAGWSLGKRIPLKVATREQTYPYFYCWCAGFFFMLLGAIGNYSVSHTIDEGEMNFQTASAYWYLLYYVGYPGLAIALWAGIKIKTPSRYVLWVLTLAGLVAFMLPQVESARRGPLFPAVIALILVPPLTLRRPPNRVVYCAGLLGAGIVMLLFVQVRETIYNGGTWGEAFQKLDVDDAVISRGGDADDNEYVNNCQVIATIYQNGKYEYGTGHLELFVHWVPRALWWNKPTIGEGVYSFKDMFDDVEKNTGVRLLGFGASAAGVADSFTQYGILCPLYWFALAFGLGVVYARVLRTGSPWWMFSYVGFCCSTHWLISQSFAAAFVPCMYFQLIPLSVLWSLWLYRRWSVVPRKVGPRRPLAARALPS